MAMITLSLVSGVLAAAGVETYRRHQRTKQFGRTLAAGSTLLPPACRPTPPPDVLVTIRDFLLRGKLPAAATCSLAEEPQATMATSDMHQWMEQNAINMRVAYGAAVLSGAGLLGVPFATLLSIPPLIYLSMDSIRMAYQQVVHQRQVGIYVPYAVICLGVLGLRLFFVDSVLFILNAWSIDLMSKTYHHTRHDLTSIIGDVPAKAWVRYGESELQVPLDQVQVGDTLVVHAGETIPVDGTIIVGWVSVDQHQLTGEAQPVEKGCGDRVFAGTVVLSGIMDVRVEQAGNATTAAQIANVLARTTDYISSQELKGRHLADTLVMPQLLLSLGTLLVLNPVAALAVLFAPCGDPMIFYSPLSVLTFLRLASRLGILVKDGRALETLVDVDTVVFDKTGTLTHECPHVAAVHGQAGSSEDEVLRLAATAEYKQTHPIARAIQAEADMRQLAVVTLEDARYEVGYGVHVTLETGQVVQVGSARFLHNEGIVMPTDVVDLQARCHAHGHSLVYVAVDGALIGAIELHATIRSEAAQIVAHLQQRGIEVVVLSGDQHQPTAHLARTLGITRYYAEVLPADKSRLVKELQHEGRTVCFVGDGINDSIALKQAHVGVSLQGASAIAMDTAEILLLDESLREVGTLFDLAERLDRNQQRNLVISIVPGLVVIGGVFIGHAGILTVAISNVVWGCLGIGNALAPSLGHRTENWTAKVCSAQQLLPATGSAPQNADE